MRVSLQTIAEHLGVNRSTVSRALRRDPMIPLRTRDPILAACKEFGYQPHALISELATSHWQARKVIGGNVIAYIDRNNSSREFGPGLGSSLVDQAAILGYRLQMFRWEEYSSSTKLQRVLRNRGITDIILGPVYKDAVPIELDWSKFTCVQLLPALFPLPFHSVVKDHFNGVVLAWQKAVASGYRRIGTVLLKHPEQVMDDVMRVSAVHACQTQLFPTLPTLPTFNYENFLGYHSKRYAVWVRRHQPDVVIAFDDAHYHFFRSEFGYDLPYISLHNREGVSLSGIVDDDKTGGREAVNLLHICRRTYQWGIPQRRIDHVIEPIWYEGDSLPRKGPPSVEPGVKLWCAHDTSVARTH